MMRLEIRGGQRHLVRTVLAQLPFMGMARVRDCEVVTLYFFAGEFTDDQMQHLCQHLIQDPVTQTAVWSRGEATGDVPTTGAVETTRKRGVTDTEARALEESLARLHFPVCEVVRATRYEFQGDLVPADLHQIAQNVLCNATTERYGLGRLQPHFGYEAKTSPLAHAVPLLELSDAELMRTSRERVLSLSLAEMQRIQYEFRRQEREPTDVELESLAQTWSEHCQHKTFKARIDFTHTDARGQTLQHLAIDGLFPTYIRGVNDRVAKDWLVSVFEDDAGVIRFTPELDVAFKVETHNHPSALDPFGGAHTGVGGVVRDILGVSARPVAMTDVLCFGPADLPDDEVPAGILHPRRIRQGVVAGIGDYGNKLGLPTLSGAIIYDPGYVTNPLVYCGCIGVVPHGTHPVSPQVGDLVVALGGRTGLDGLHGATFSSAELEQETQATLGSAVQIGDPILEKGLIELVTRARDENLYTAITDCGAGGFSSAVGEMGAALGVKVDLAQVKVKYPDLTPWELWLSEAQERMVLAVPEARLPRLRALAELWDVELSVLGCFTGDRKLQVCYGEHTVGELEMDFLHHGWPRPMLQAVYREPACTATSVPVPATGHWNDTLLLLLAHPSVASKEAVIRTYDHEVRGGTLVRPLTGPAMDGPADGVVFEPLEAWPTGAAIAVSQGINPVLGLHDPYAMAVSAVDEAVRNLVCCGADPERIALLDNFCWGNPTLPDRLGALVRACQGCHDGAVALQTPFISGKDSLYNEYDGTPIPGTVLISALSVVQDVHCCVTSYFKTAGSAILVLGDTRSELGGSLLHYLEGIAGGTSPVLQASFRERYHWLHARIREGVIRSAHDASEGGLAVALAEMALAGRLGVQVDLQDVHLDPCCALFSESNGRILLEVDPRSADDLIRSATDVPLWHLGQVGGERFRIEHNGTELVDLPLCTLIRYWQGERD